MVNLGNSLRFFLAADAEEIADAAAVLHLNGGVPQRPLFT